MNATPRYHVRRSGRPGFGVTLDETRLADYLLDLGAYDEDRPDLDCPVVTIDLRPQDAHGNLLGSFRVVHGLQEEQPLFLSSLDAAIAHAVYRVQGFLDVHQDDLLGLTDQILEDPQHAYTQRLVASAL